jgi:hypothetical protein
LCVAPLALFLAGNPATLSAKAEGDLPSRKERIVLFFGVKTPRDDALVSFLSAGLVPVTGVDMLPMLQTCKAWYHNANR